jgi:hypothetical protein
MSAQQPAAAVTATAAAAGELRIKARAQRRHESTHKK